MDIIHAKLGRDNRYDLNKDGYANYKEIEMLTNHLKGIKLLEGEMLAKADFNNDGKITLLDLAMLKAHINNKTENPVNIKEEKIITNYKKYNIILSSGSSYKDNDWEMIIPIEEWENNNIELGDYIYIPKTEYGGVVERIKNNARDVIVGGANFRSFLYKHIVSPDVNIVGGKVSYTDYYRYSGSVNKVIYELINHSPIVVDGVRDTNSRNQDYYITDDETGISVKGQIRYQSMLSSIEKVLYNTGYRVKIEQDYFTWSDDYEPYETVIQGTNHVARVSVVPIKDYSDTEYFSNDYEAIITSSIDDVDNIDYVVALGKGELENREVFIFQFDENKKIAKEINFESEPVFNRNTAIYDNPNAESKQEMIEGATELFIGSRTKKEVGFNINHSQIEFDLGDKVGGYDSVTGINVVATITQKELTIENGRLSLQYKVGE